MSDTHRLFSLIIIIFSLSIYLPNFADAQEGMDSLTHKLAYIGIERTFKEIKVGDHVPDVVMGKAIRFFSNTPKFSDFVGKVLILDFWSQWCASCIAAMPRLESLQQKFGDSVIILPVTFQSKQSAIAFFKKRSSQNSPIELPSIVEDTLLRKYFPHEGEPHEVWIGADGYVKAITQADQITAENIEKLLLTDSLNLPLKSRQWDFDIDKPFLVANNGGPDSAFVCRSIFTNKINSIATVRGLRTNSKGINILYTNASAFDLYEFAYSEWDSADFGSPLLTSPFNRRIIVDSNLNGAFYDRRNHGYCYELSLPQGFNKSNGFSMMIDDLDRFLKIRSKISQQQISCLVLVKTEETQPKNNPHQYKGNSGVSYSSPFRNFSFLGDLVHFINTYYPDLPLTINEAGPDLQFVNIRLCKDSTQAGLSTLQNALHSQGYDLVKQQRLIPMLVIEQNKPSDLPSLANRLPETSRRASEPLTKRPD
jgi:thiol-disulfide isomerase/thioredoxin